MQSSKDLINFHHLWVTFLRRWHEIGQKTDLNSTDETSLRDLQHGLVERYRRLKIEIPPLVELVSEFDALGSLASLSDGDWSRMCAKVEHAEREGALWFERRARKSSLLRRFQAKWWRERFRVFMLYPMLFLGIVSVFVGLAIHFYLLRG